MAISEAFTLARESFDRVDSAIANRDLQAARGAYLSIEVTRWSPFRRLLEMDIERWPSAVLLSRATAFEGALDGYNQTLGKVLSQVGYPGATFEFPLAASSRKYFDEMAMHLEEAIYRELIH